MRCRLLKAPHRRSMSTRPCALAEIEQEFSMRFRLLAPLYTLLFLALAAVTISTVPARSGEAAADIALLTPSCSGCHAKDLSNEDFPQIYGRPASEIRDAMLAYRSLQAFWAILTNQRAMLISGHEAEELVAEHKDALKD